MKFSSRIDLMEWAKVEQNKIDFEKYRISALNLFHRIEKELLHF
jgi:hypothetical protein